MKNKAYGDFGNESRNNADFGMGDLGWSYQDELNKWKSNIETYTKSFESKAGDWLKLQTQSLPPEIRAQMEAEIKKGGAKSVADLKAMAQQKMIAYAQAQAKAKALDPANQNMAISSGVEAGAKQFSQALISLKTLLMAGQYKQAFKKHPLIYGVPMGLLGILAVKGGISFTRFLVGKKRSVKANPSKRVNKKRKFKIKKIK